MRIALAHADELCGATSRETIARTRALRLGGALTPMTAAMSRALVPASRMAKMGWSARSRRAAARARIRGVTR